MKDMVKQFLKDEEGTTAVEYGVMVSLVAVALITAVALLRGAIITRLGTAQTAIETGAP